MSGYTGSRRLWQKNYASRMNDTEIKSLWRGQPAPVAELPVMRARINRFRSRRIAEACAVILLMMAAIAFGVLIWTCWPPQLILTRVGIVLACAGFMLPVWSYGRALSLYYGLNPDCSNRDYMARLSKIRRTEYKRQHVVLNLYFLLLSSGFALYTYEYAFSRSWRFGVVACSVLLLWIALNWFVLRPHLLKRRNRRFAEFERWIESYGEQLSE